MKNKNEKLFQKFKEEALLETSKNLIKGGGPDHSDDTGDHDCTSQVGQSDCTDENTNVLEDTSVTLPDDDACGL